MRPGEIKSFVNAYSQLMRVPTSLLAGVASLSVALRSGNEPSALLTSLVVFLLTAGGFTLNDWFDQEVDHQNSPSRPIPSGRVPPEAALFWAVLLLAIGNFISAMQDNAHLLFSLGITAILVLYSPILRRVILLANIATAGLCTAVLYFGRLAQPVGDGLNALATVLFLFILGREILLDIPHVKGDAQFGRPTIASVLSPRMALVISRASILFAASIAVLLANLTRQPRIAQCLLLVGCFFFFLAFFAFPKASSNDISHFRRVSRFALFGLVLAFLFF